MENMGDPVDNEQIAQYMPVRATGYSIKKQYQMQTSMWTQR